MPLRCSLAVLLAALCASAAPSVKIGSTTVVGRDNSFASFQQEFFGGIPYAEPPTGHLRFVLPPVLKTGIDAKTFDASDYGPACLQTGAPVDLKVSEDCLTINILRPSGIPQSAYPLPVMFWTYGGGFYEGNSRAYNASLIVGQRKGVCTPIIYVNFNYRLGPLGFAQGNEAARNGALNIGLKDQLAALQWVQANIGAFGGDKNKVTLFGQSAGSMIISSLFMGPSLNGLARAAIFESGWAASLGVYSPSRNQLDWDHFAAAIPQCASFACIQSNASTSDLLTAMNATLASTVDSFPWVPVLDGELIKDLPSRILSRGQFAKLPFIAGTTLDEGTTFTSPTIGSADELRALLLQSVLRTSSNISAVPSVELQKAVDELLALHPDVPALGSPFNTGNQTFGLSSTFKRASAIRTDLQAVALRRQFMDAASSAGVSAYGYLFTQPQPELPPFLGVTHGSELTYLYGPPSDESVSSIALSSILMDYWVSFATSLTLNDGLGTIPRPKWSAYTSKNQAVIQLNEANLTMIPDDFRSARSSFASNVAQNAFVNKDPLGLRITVVDSEDGHKDPDANAALAGFVLGDQHGREFKVAQERRFHALQREPGELARFKAAQVDGLKDQHSYMPAALSPPLKGRSVSLDTHMQGHPEPNPHSLNLSSARTTSSLRDSTASILSQQAQATSVDLMQMQMQQAELEIARARDVVRGLEEQRDDAERQASHAKKIARRLRAENLALVAREKGRKEGYETGFGHGRVVAMARVEREREKQKQKQQQEQERRRVEAEEMARRRRIEAPPPTTTTVEPPRAEEPSEPLQRRLSSTSAQHAAPARRSSLRQTTAPQPDPITVAQPLERSNTVSSSSTTHSDALTARPRAASMRAPSRVSIIEPPAPLRAPSVRSTGGPGVQSTSQRNSSFTALTSLDSLGLGTPRGMPVSALMPQMPPAPPMQPQPPIGWSYPEAQPEPERERVHVPMPPPPPTVMQARTHSRAPDNINVAVAQEDRTGNRTTTPTSSITSSVSTSLRNLRLTSFPVSGTGAGRDRERERELSVILEHHAEGSVSPSGNGNGNGSVASAWASPYADPSSVEMDAWRRGSGSRSGSGVDTPRPMPAAGMPVAREETPVIPPQLQQAQQHWQQPSGTATPVPMLSPYGSGTSSYVQPQVQGQGPLSQDNLRRSSSASTSTVNITVVPPSRPASTGLGQTAAQTDPAHGGHRRRPGLLSADSIDSESESDSDDDDDSPGPVHPRVLNPLPAFAQGVVMPPPGSVRGGGGAGGGAFPSGFVPIGGGLPPGAVTGGVGVGIGLGGSGTGTGGFVTESVARPLSRGPPLLGVTPPNNHSGFTVESARRQPASTSTTPVPTTRMGGGPPSMFSNTTDPPAESSKHGLGNGGQGNLNGSGLYAYPSTGTTWNANANTNANNQNNQQQARPPSRQGSALYTPAPPATTGSFTAGRIRFPALLQLQRDLRVDKGSALYAPTPPATTGSFTVESARDRPGWANSIPGSTATAARPPSRQGSALYAPAPPPSTGSFTVESARDRPTWETPNLGPTAARPPSRQGSALYAPAPTTGMGAGTGIGSFTVEPVIPRPPLLGTQGQNFGGSGFNVEPAGRPVSRAGMGGGGGVAGSQAPAQGWAYGPQFSFGGQSQPVPAPAFVGTGNTASDRSTTPRPMIYAPIPAGGGAFALPPSVASSTTTTTSHRRRQSVGTTPAFAPRSLADSQPDSSSHSRGAGRYQNNQTPHPGQNLGISSPYTQADQIRDDEYGDGDAGSEVSSLGMASLTMRNTFQNANPQGHGGDRERGSQNREQSQRHSVGSSSAHSYRPMR
ncbi:hypothetical protein C8F01DRAFT_1237939 [Mycena amicta]|nr:hypothetical protein C8F01DRAFT_1237939 [Mycena amicta]